jgi:hypothetical protein
MGGIGAIAVNTSFAQPFPFVRTLELDGDVATKTHHRR